MHIDTGFETQSQVYQQRGGKDDIRGRGDMAIQGRDEAGR